MKRSLTLGLFALLAAAFYLAGFDATSASGPKAVTFNKDVAPILFKDCVQCHRPNEIAPMSFLTYKEARPWARSIREKVLAREMPPWHADPHFGEFSNDRRLSQKEIDTIVAWVDQGAKEGNPKDLPPAPQADEGWHIGKPDLVLSVPEEYTLAAEGPDEYIYFKIPTNFKEDMWVQAAEAMPGNRRVVHHILAFVRAPRPAPPANAKKAAPVPKAFQEAFEKNVIFYEDGKLIRVKPDVPVIDDGCSTPSGGNGILRGGGGQDGFGNLLCGQAPGYLVEPWPAGVAKKIPAGSTILLQIHYARNGKVEKDRSSIGLKFSKAQPDKLLAMEPIRNYHFQIPPGAENHEVSACYTVKDDIHIYSIAPHMHLRGKDMTVYAFYADGRSETLLSVPRYSFSWQTSYIFKQPVAVPKGTRLKVVAHFDNSAKNKYNPDAAKPVRFGDPTYDEMMIGFMEYTLDSQHLAKPEVAKSAASASK